MRDISLLTGNNKIVISPFYRSVSLRRGVRNSFALSNHFPKMNLKTRKRQTNNKNLIQNSKLLSLPSYLVPPRLQISYINLLHQPHTTTLSLQANCPNNFQMLSSPVTSPRAKATSSNGATCHPHRIKNPFRIKLHTEVITHSDLHTLH